MINKVWSRKKSSLTNNFLINHDFLFPDDYSGGFLIVVVVVLSNVDIFYIDFHTYVVKL